MDSAYERHRHRFREKKEEKNLQGIPKLEEKIPAEIEEEIEAELEKEKLQFSKKFESIRIITLIDNKSLEENLKPSWGLSLLIIADALNILFDAGNDPTILLSNMNSLHISTKQLTSVFISHNHKDHTSGLSVILTERPDLRIFAIENSNLEKEFPVATIQKISNAEEIYPGAYAIPFKESQPPEQVLVLNTEKGLIVITGCAHPGIEEIISKVKSLFNENIYLVMGGFHLMNKEDEELEKIIGIFRRANVEKVSPMHCTGEKAILLFEEAYGENFIENGAGKLVVIE